MAAKIFGGVRNSSEVFGSHTLTKFITMNLFSGILNKEIQIPETLCEIVQWI